jgi:predicted MFS family arabinose efflux permease
MLLGNGLFIAGVTLIAIWPTFPAFVIWMGLSSLGKYVLDSAILAFIGDEVPVRQRGRAFGIVELSWALSYLAGIWFVRILMERSGWLAPFPVIGVLALGVWVGIVAWVPARGSSDAEHELSESGAAAILRNPAAVLALLVSVSISAASELVAVVFAAWLEDSFGFTLAALAGAAVLIGFAELSGESLVGVLMDRLGALRSVGLGLVLNSLFALLLPIIGRSPGGALFGLFCFFLTFEFTIVSGISVITAVPTRSRATLIALNIASLSIGRIVSAWIALPLYGLGLFVVLGIAVLVNLGGLAALRRLALRLATT